MDVRRPLWPLPFAIPTLVAALAAFVLAAACQPPVHKARPTWPTAPSREVARLTPEQEEQARHLYLTLQKAAQAGDHEGSAAMQAALLRRFAGSEAAACIHEAKASHAAKAGAWAEALAELEQIMAVRPQFARIDETRRNFALWLVQAGRQSEAVDFFASLPAGPAGSPQEHARQELGRALIEPLVAAGRAQPALVLLVASKQFAGTSPAEAAAAEARALALLPQLSDEAAAELLRAHEKAAPWQFLRSELALRLAKSPTLAADEAEQERLLGLVVAAEPGSALGQEAGRLLAQATLRHQVEPHTIGILLPLTGRFTQFGERAKAAIEMALTSRPDLRVVVKDTAGDPNLAAQAIESLVYESHAIAAIGPLFSAEAAAAASRAEALGLPLLSLSHQEGLTKTGPTIFRTGLTVPAQAKALAKVAFERLGMQRFAILAPQSRYGMDFLQAFWDEVDARQGSIRGVELYAPDATTFRQPIRKLVGRWFLNARPEFRDPLKALKEQELSGVRMRAEVERLDKRTRPVIDFDALIIPDSGRQLGLIAPALAFEDIAVSRDEKALDKMRRTLGQNDIMPITLLGASPWNSQQTLDGCELYCERAVFVDAFFAGASKGPSKDFAAAFWTKVGSDPALGEAQAFDTAGLLASVLQGRQWPSKRLELIAALHAVQNYQGVCGPTSFDALGESQRELQALTIYGHRIVPLEQAPPLPPMPKAAPAPPAPQAPPPVRGSRS